MSCRWDGVERVMPVPYMPILGPVRPGSRFPELFAAVVAAAATGRGLSYDKDRRWSDQKTERVLVDAVEYGRQRTVIPTFFEQAAGTVRVHVYGEGLTGDADLARQVADQVPGTVVRKAGQWRLSRAMGNEQARPRQSFTGPSCPSDPRP